MERYDLQVNSSNFFQKWKDKYVQVIEFAPGNLLCKWWLYLPNNISWTCLHHFTKKIVINFIPFFPMRLLSDKKNTLWCLLHYNHSTSIESLIIYIFWTIHYIILKIHLNHRTLLKKYNKISPILNIFKLYSFSIAILLLQIPWRVAFR